MEWRQETGGIAMRRLRSTGGMTLMEVTIALFVLAIGLLGLAGLHLVAMQSDSLGQQATLASNLAKNKLTELQKTEQLTDGTDQYVDRNNGVTYIRHWIIQSDIPQEDMTTVKVRVSWQGPMVDRCVTVSTVIKRT
jgi:type II secretory pathway pseudopilin PulG